MAGLIAACALAATVVSDPAGAAAGPASGVPAFSHVVEVMLENQSATSTFEDASAAPELAKLRRRGVYLPKFFGVGHASLDNYEAAFAAVQPTPQGESDCLGQPFGSCIFPASVPTFGGLLDAHGRSWKVYSEGMAGAPGGGNCLHAPSRNAPDPYQGPGTNGYATRHNPAPWFDSVLDKGGSETYCQAHSVDLTRLWTDAGSSTTLPSWSFVEPDTCHDGHDTSSSGGCGADPEGTGAPSGVAAIEAWLPGFVSRLTGSPAWDSRSLLVITFDEGAGTDLMGCAGCHDGSAGGRIGALLIGGPVAAPGATSQWAGDHYSLLRTWEAAWGLPSLKSRAVSAAAAASVHDGDPLVAPLTGIWQLAGGGTPACQPGSVRIPLGRGQITAAAAYLGGRMVASARGRHLRTLLVKHP
ncbi:MAG TPA: alkaline phosphatase family protein, partial [Solirubrobacteraceae bacterium]|nr:alkaline phosphatase family protein [Solirubrobacteraceae bacterium]